MRPQLVVGTAVVSAACGWLFQEVRSPQSRQESIELYDPAGSTSVRISVTGGQLVFSSESWPSSMQVRLGSKDGSSGLEIWDREGERSAFLGVQGKSGGPALELRDKASGSEVNLDIKDKRGGALAIFGEERTPRFFAGSQPDGSVKLMLFDPKGGPGVACVSGAEDKNAVMVCRVGHGDIGAQLVSKENGASALFVHEEGAAVVGLGTEIGGTASLRIGSKDGENAIELTGAGDKPPHLKMYAAKQTPLAAMLADEHGMVLALFNKSGEPVFVVPER